MDLLGELIDRDKELTLVGKANNGEDMCKIIEQKQPDVVLLDLIMPKMDGLSVMEQINTDKKNSKKASEFYRCDSCRTGTNDSKMPLKKWSELLYYERPLTTGCC